jgi:hypothetical protein
MSMFVQGLARIKNQMSEKFLVEKDAKKLTGWAYTIEEIDRTIELVKHYGLE